MPDWPEILQKFPAGYEQVGAGVRRVFRNGRAEAVVEFTAEEASRSRRFVLAMVEKREARARATVGLPADVP